MKFQESTCDFRTNDSLIQIPDYLLQNKTSVVVNFGNLKTPPTFNAFFVYDDEVEKVKKYKALITTEGDEARLINQKDEEMKKDTTVKFQEGFYYLPKKFYMWSMQMFYMKHVKYLMCYFKGQQVPYDQPIADAQINIIDSYSLSDFEYIKQMSTPMEKHQKLISCFSSNNSKDNRSSSKTLKQKPAFEDYSKISKYIPEIYIPRQIAFCAYAMSYLAPNYFSKYQKLIFVLLDNEFRTDIEFEIKVPRTNDLRELLGLFRVIKIQDLKPISKPINNRGSKTFSPFKELLQMENVANSFMVYVQPFHDSKFMNSLESYLKMSGNQFVDINESNLLNGTNALIRYCNIYQYIRSQLGEIVIQQQIEKHGIDVQLILMQYLMTSYEIDYQTLLSQWVNKFREGNFSVKEATSLAEKQKGVIQCK